MLYLSAALALLHQIQTCLTGLTLYFTMALLEVIGGFLTIGYVLASLNESFFHEHIGHARPRTREFWRRYPRIGKPFLAAYFSQHILHHAKTFRKNFLTQFVNEDEKRKLDEWIPEAFYRQFDPRDRPVLMQVLPPAELVKWMQSDDYGLSVADRSIITFVAPSVPSALILFLVLPFWVVIGAMIMMFVVYPLMSKTVHPDIHRTASKVSWADIPCVRRFLDWFMSTTVMKIVSQEHWMHHEYVICSFNLMPLGDILRRKRRKPTQKDRDKMAAEGLYVVSYPKAVTGSWLGRLQTRLQRGIWHWWYAK